jgi:hypothetical protein
VFADNDARRPVGLGGDEPALLRVTGARYASAGHSPMTAAFGTPLGGITTIVEDGDLLISAGPSASNV